MQLQKSKKSNEKWRKEKMYRGFHQKKKTLAHIVDMLPDV